MTFVVVARSLCGLAEAIASEVEVEADIATVVAFEEVAAEAGMAAAGAGEEAAAEAADTAAHFGSEEVV